MPNAVAELEATGISRRVGGRLLLDGIDLRLGAGDRIALGGPSGSGKTQLLRALALLDPIDAGEVLWRGAPVADGDVPTYRGRVVYHQQIPALAEGTVGETLRRPFALVTHAGRRFDAARALALFDRLGQDGSLYEAAIGDLSGGERQIVALVRVLLLEPTILLLDEPTASLDAASEERVVAMIADWVEHQGERRAYIWVTHDERLSRLVSDRGLHLAAGRLRTEPSR